MPNVKRRALNAHHEYRTKRVILEIHDELAAAMGTGVPYQSASTRRRRIRGWRMGRDDLWSHDL